MQVYVDFKEFCKESQKPDMKFFSSSAPPFCEVEIKKCFLQQQNLSIFRYLPKKLFNKNSLKSSRKKRKQFLNKAKCLEHLQRIK